MARSPEQQAKRREACKRYYHAHREELRAKANAYYAENREYVLEMQKIWEYRRVLKKRGLA